MRLRSVHAYAPGTGRTALNQSSLYPHECHVQRGPASSVTAHMLRSYARTLGAILRAQYEKGTLSEGQMTALR